MREKEWPEVVKEAKAKLPYLEKIFSEEDMAFKVFARFFLENLGDEVTPHAVVHTFSHLVAYFYCPSEKFRNKVPLFLRALPARRQAGLYRKFPRIVWALFDPIFATRAIWEYQELNRRTKNEMAKTNRSRKRRAR